MLRILDVWDELFLSQPKPTTGQNKCKERHNGAVHFPAFLSFADHTYMNCCRLNYPTVYKVVKISSVFAYINTAIKVILNTYIHIDRTFI